MRTAESGRAGGLVTYLRIVGHGPAGRPWAAAVVARLPVSMTPLGIVLLVQHVTGSYGVAGLVSGAFAVGTAVGAPLSGRALDRCGQPWVVAATSTLSAAFLLTLAVASVARASVPALVGLAVATGATFPPMTPAMRASWRVALANPAHQRAAYALDAVSVETIFIAGPLLLSLLLVISAPVVPLAVTALLMLVGGVAYALTSAARAAHGRAGQPAAGPQETASGSRSPAVPGSARAARADRVDRVVPVGLLPVLAIGLGLAVAFGAIDTSLAATARDVLRDQARLGLLFTSIAGGSTLSGLWFGTRDLAQLAQLRFLPCCCWPSPAASPRSPSCWPSRCPPCRC